MGCVVTNRQSLTRLYNTAIVYMKKWTGKLFTPRGLSGINTIIAAELREIGLTKLKMEKDLHISGISDLRRLGNLRVPQSLWVPLATAEVESVNDVARVIDQIDWSNVPKLNSHGPRITISADNLLFKNESELLEVLRQKSGDTGSSEFSMRIDQDNQLSLSLNAIPPRPWLETPMELTIGEKSADWWSVNAADVSRPRRPSDSLIKLFRNESSLSCLCAALVRISPVITWLDSEKADELLVWDPFVGNGALLLEILQRIADRPSSIPKHLTIVGNVKTKDSLELVERRLSKFVNSRDGILSEVDSTEGVIEEVRPRGRKSVRSSPVEPDAPFDEECANRKIHTQTIRIGDTVVDLHLTTVAFTETLPYINGGVVMSHIPKTYNELTGIDKHELSEWTAFGNLIRSRGNAFEAFFLTETFSFAKYAKLKFSKLFHLVSPSGKSVGHYLRWIGV